MKVGTFVYFAVLLKRNITFDFSRLDNCLGPRLGQYLYLNAEGFIIDCRPL